MNGLFVPAHTPDAFFQAGMLGFMANTTTCLRLPGHPNAAKI